MMEKAMVFIGIDQNGVIEAAVCADSLAGAKQLLPGLNVIKMTSKTRLFVTCPSFPAGKKLMLSGATKRPKGAILPTPSVYVFAGQIEFVAPVYIDGEAVKSLMHVRFANTPGQPSQCQVCE
jgi:hypothetical protein